MAMLGSWVLFTKSVKLLPHFVHHPSDLKFLPISIIFSYLHGIINIHAIFTLDTTTWSSKNLEELNDPRAEMEEIIPLLRRAMSEAEPWPEPIPGEHS